MYPLRTKASEALIKNIETIPNAIRVLSRSFCTGDSNREFSQFIRAMTFQDVEKELGNKPPKKFAEIPGPPPLPFFGTMWLYYRPFKLFSFERLHETYDRMYKMYGPVVKEVHSGNRTLVHLFHQEDIKTVCEHQGELPKRMSHTSLAKYRAQRKELYDGPGVIPSNGPYWWNFRKNFQEALMKEVGGVRDLLEDVVDEMLEEFPHLINSNGEIDVMPLFARWALESMDRILLNKRLGCLSRERNEEADTLIEMSHETHLATYLLENNRFATFKYERRLRKAQDIFASIVKKRMDEALETIHKEENQKCLLAKMLKHSPRVDRRDVFTMVIDSFLGGIDNSSYTLTMALYHLAQNKRWQTKLREELLVILPTKNHRYTAEKRNIENLSRTLSETLRITPHAVANGRITESDMVLGGYMVPANTIVLLQHQVASLLDRHFPSAHLFQPEASHLYDEDGIPKKNYATMPFGLGSRACIGVSIAVNEIFIALAKILRNYEVSYHHEKIGFKTRLMNVPDRPVKLKFTKLEN